MFDTIDVLSRNKFDIGFLAKEEILQRLPAQIRELEQVKNKVQVQLVEYVKCVQTGFNVSRVFKAYCKLTTKVSLASQMPSYRPCAIHSN
jgi:hypothetical protein